VFRFHCAHCLFPVYSQSYMYGKFTECILA
jgi:hypothetical protein